MIAEVKLFVPMCDRCETYMEDCDGQIRAFQDKEEAKDYVEDDEWMTTQDGKHYCLECKVDLKERRITELMNLASKIISMNKIKDIPIVAVTGSLALNLYGIPIDREIKDLDLVTNEDVHEIELPDEFEVQDVDKGYGIDYISYSDGKTKIDIFKSDETQFVSLHTLIVATRLQIFEAKERIIKETKSDETRLKHANDIALIKKYVGL